MTGEHDGQPLTWIERFWVVRSLKLAERQACTLRRRLAQAVAAITELNVPRQGKKRFTEEEALAAAVEALIAQHRVAGLLRLDYQTQLTRPSLRRGPSGATVTAPPG